MNEFQDGIDRWLAECFPPEAAKDGTERCDRFIEEALELIQACGYAPERAHALVDYVFGRPKGDQRQEVGGTMVTLAALCSTFAIDLGFEARRELARIGEPETMAKIRAKQAAKPVGSALPIAVEPASTPQLVEIPTALRQAERALVAAYGEPDGTALESRAGAAAIQAVRATLQRFPAFARVPSPNDESNDADRLAKAQAADPECGKAATLPDVLKMLDAWTDVTLPADAEGKIHFGRAMLEAAADAIRQHLASTRREVAAFALLMERELRANDHKGGWKDDAALSLFATLLREVGKLDRALLNLSAEGIRNLERNRAAVIRETADIANMAMMIADVVGGLREPKVEGGAA